MKPFSLFDFVVIGVTTFAIIYAIIIPGRGNYLIGYIIAEICFLSMYILTNLWRQRYEKLLAKYNYLLEEKNEKKIPD